jgi:hypothetical protein
MAQHEEINMGESPMSPETTPAAKQPGDAAVRGTETGREQPTDQETEVAWKQIEETYTPVQYALLRRLSKNGVNGFHRIKSAEAAPAGAIKAKPSRFKPPSTR